MVKKYKKNFLSNVVCKIDFPKVLALKEGPIEFQKVINTKFPHLKEDKKLEINLDLMTGLGQQDFTLCWLFSNKEKNKIIGVTSDSLFLEYKQHYVDFQEFKEDFEFMSSNFFKIYPVGVITRIGLRYINEIKISEGNPLEWDGLIRKELIEHLKFFKEKSGLARSMQLVEIVKDDYKLRFKYGLFNSDFPAKISRKEFVLDFDCITLNELEQSGIMSTASKFNEVITDFFEDSISDGLKKILNEE